MSHDSSVASSKASAAIAAAVIPLTYRTTGNSPPAVCSAPLCTIIINHQPSIIKGGWHGGAACLDAVVEELVGVAHVGEEEVPRRRVDLSGAPDHDLGEHVEAVQEIHHLGQRRGAGGRAEAQPAPTFLLGLDPLFLLLRPAISRCVSACACACACCCCGRVWRGLTWRAWWSRSSRECL